MSILEIHTDGACSGNQNENNLGGWGAVLLFGENEKELYGGEKNTTNNRMEMMALYEALNALKKTNLNIKVFSDSSYLMDCFRKKWYVNWQKNGWKNSAKQPVSNKDLWGLLLPFLDIHKIEFFRVKGHVNLSSPSTNTQKLFEKFTQWNGNSFDFNDFIHITEMNNRADALANKGIDSIR